MGVYKLWELLLTIAQRVEAQQLGGKVLAIDASIWIVKIDSLYSSNAEKLKSMLSKIMLLKRNNILPVFVFDGVAPALKRKTLEERYRRRLVTTEQEARKKSELEVMRIVEGNESSTRLSERSRKAQKNQEQLSQLNKTLENLSKFQEEAQKEVSNEILQKISLQSQILNTKYKIILELTPSLASYRFFVPFEQYQSLDLQQKIEYLQELQQQKWKQMKAQRRNNRVLTQQQRLMKDIQAIEKRSIIREMQDNLFRKMMQKNVVIRDGFQIVQTIYNGRKVVQKRKIRDQPSNGFGINLRKGNMKNDVNCLNFQHQKSSEDQEQDDFLAEFCSSAVTSKPKPRQEYDQPPEDNSRGSNLTHPNKKKKSRNNKRAASRSNDESEESPAVFPLQNYQVRQHEDDPQKYVNKEELRQVRAETGEDEFEDRDHLPAYVPNESLLYINYSNDNIQLQNLLKVLGIPYLIAPAEAEAQCAALQQLGIVDGVVTEDSDAFLFGAKHVFRGVFQSNIRLYDYHNIQERLLMNREKLIIFALLLGSDYTAGVKGVGLVNAMEILKVFTSFDRLQTFKNWARLPDVLLPSNEATDELLKTATPAEIEFYQLHRKFKNHWYVDEQFGSSRVLEAYLKPEVIDSSKVLSLQKEGAFQMKECNKTLLQKLLHEKLGLEDRQFEHFMKVLTFQFKIKRENTLLNYFPRLDESNQMARIRSKRLQKSLMPSQNHQNND